jgi:hypothetical protein
MGEGLASYDDSASLGSQGEDGRPPELVGWIGEPRMMPLSSVIYRRRVWGFA